MKSLWVAAFGWLVLAAALLLWSRPRRAERRQLGPIDLFELLPGRDWRSRVPPLHWDAFQALRRRAQAAAALALASLALFAGFWLVTGEPGAPRHVRSPSAVTPSEAGATEPLVAAGSTGRGAAAAPGAEIPAGLPTRALAPPSPRELVGTAQLRPAFEDGVQTGLRVLRAKPDGPWAAAGIANGDVLLSVNGRAMDGRSAPIALMEELGSAPELTLLVRSTGGQERVVTVPPADVGQ